MVEGKRPWIGRYTCCLRKEVVCRVDSLKGWWKVVQRQTFKVWKGVDERRYGGKTCSLWVWGWVLFSLIFIAVKLGCCKVFSVWNVINTETLSAKMKWDLIRTTCWDIWVAKLSQENNETVAMLVEQKIPLGIGFSFHANVSFPFTKSTWSPIIVWKTICKTKSYTATGL